MAPEKRQPATLPDPWLFDSEALLRELDRCRETALNIPTNGDANATHFGIQLTVSAIWNLREQIRWLLAEHRAGQRQWQRRAATALSDLQTPPVAKQTEARPAKARRRA